MMNWPSALLTIALFCQVFADNDNSTGTETGMTRLPIFIPTPLPLPTPKVRKILQFENYYYDPDYISEPLRCTPYHGETDEKLDCNFEGVEDDAAEQPSMEGLDSAEMRRICEIATYACYEYRECSMGCILPSYTIYPINKHLLFPPKNPCLMALQFCYGMDIMTYLKDKGIVDNPWAF
ncbi:hypothetical protein WR25_02763 [Diploscapter pachys]|uniref:Domain of unknown function DB domain-containing protein n=1 Tax=Diploscapter pachys TaxID=2018661 RepID=A0A2A2J2V0_9BILA|nr:hypothetical protein WR25_02763 [Diploscapter pachys]